LRSARNSNSSGSNSRSVSVGALMGPVYQMSTM
jgi:hypothetical protein